MENEKFENQMRRREEERIAFEERIRLLEKALHQKEAEKQQSLSVNHRLQSENLQFAQNLQAVNSRENSGWQEILVQTLTTITHGLETRNEGPTITWAWIRF